MATGELFLGLASRLIIKRGDYLNAEGGAEGNNGSGPGVTILPGSDRAESWWRRRSKEEVASVVEDPVQPDVVWEQRKKDVEAERGRKAVTSPGFSFSAAGLLFPYHLGVAQLLLEKGYIKVCLFVCLNQLVVRLLNVSFEWEIIKIDYFLEVLSLNIAIFAVRYVKVCSITWIKFPLN